MTFSLATEFVENETYTDEIANTYRKLEEQDCELKVSYRLLKKSRKDFLNYYHHWWRCALYG